MFRFLPLLLCALAPTPAHAAESPAQPAPAPEPKPERRHGEKSPDPQRARPEAAFFLMKLLEMDDARLARMRTTIDRVEKMPAAERAALREKIRGLRDASPEQRELVAKEIREKFGDLAAPGAGPRPGDPEHRARRPEAEKGGPGRPTHDLLEKHFAAFPPDRAKAEKEKFLALPRDEKIAYLKNLRREQGLPDSPAETPPARPAKDPKPPCPDRDDPFKPAGR